MPKDRASERLKKEQARFKLFNKGRAMYRPVLYRPIPANRPAFQKKAIQNFRAAFKFFNAEQGIASNSIRRQNPDWWFLAEKLARIVFPRPGKAGRPEGSGKWSLVAIRADLGSRTVAEIRVKHPSGTTTCAKYVTSSESSNAMPGIGRLKLYGLVTKLPNGRLLKRPK